MTMPNHGRKRNSMRSRAALFAAVSLSLAALMPIAALATTDE